MPMPRLRYLARFTYQSCSNGLTSAAASCGSATAKTPACVPRSKMAVSSASASISESTAERRADGGNDFAPMKAKTNQGCIASLSRTWLAISQRRWARGSAATSAGTAASSSRIVSATSSSTISSSVSLLSK